MKFIRKNGRVIPIREKKDYGLKDIAKGAAVAGIGGVYTGHKMRKMETLGRYEIMKTRKLTDTAKKFASRQKFYKRLGLGSHVVGTYFMYQGFSKLFSGGDETKKDSVTEAASLAAGEISTQLAERGTRFGIKRFNPWWSKVKYRVLKKIITKK